MYIREQQLCYIFCFLACKRVFASIHLDLYLQLAHYYFTVFESRNVGKQFSSLKSRNLPPDLFVILLSVVNICILITEIKIYEMQRTVLHSTTHCNLRSQNGRQSAYKPAKVAGFVSRSDIFAKHSQLRSSVVAHAGGVRFIYQTLLFLSIPDHINNIYICIQHVVLQITDVDEATLEFEVANRDRPLIIDFYATWLVLIHLYHLSI